MLEIGINPVLFTLGSLEVRWYGIMIGLAVLVLVLWMVRAVRKGAAISYDTVFSLALVGIPSGIIFARLLHVIDRWGYYSVHPGQIIGGEGLSIYGAVLGAGLGLWVYSRFSNFKFGYVADILAPGIILAQAVGRIGCTINGCCYGTATSLAWGVVYTQPASFAPLGIATHPVVVYEIIFNLIAFGVLLKLRGRLKPDGSLFAVYLALYALWRLGSDFMRDGTPFLLGLHQAQVISLVVLAVAIPFMIYRTRWIQVKEEAND